MENNQLEIFSLSYAVLINCMFMFLDETLFSVAKINSEIRNFFKLYKEDIIDKPRKCFRLTESSSLRPVMLLQYKLKNTLILMIFNITCHSQTQLNEQKLSFKS